MAPSREIRASRGIPVGQDELFEFLADLENHWRLADRFIEVVALEREAGGRADGGRVRMWGPLGGRRTAATRVLAADAAHQMVGVAEIGRRTRAFVRWKLNQRERGARGKSRGHRRPVRLARPSAPTGRRPRLAGATVPLGVGSAGRALRGAAKREERKS